MLSEREFSDWLADYRSRWPAVGDYVARHDVSGTLVDTWHQTLRAFDGALLRRVTQAILDGECAPVENLKLGTFGEEIRSRCRELLERERRTERRQQWRASAAKDRQSFRPLVSGSMVDMIRCGVACDQLLAERGESIELVSRYTSGSLDPTIPYDAAIILADDHTQAERAVCEETLRRVGITWDEIVERAGCAEVRLVQSVEDVA